MASTITTTALDFDSIKQSLKTHFASKSEFADYNFEASGLSNLLDVLAYNTHYNGLIANFAVNEAFLSTAQLRESIVGLAENVGYLPGSVTSAQAVVNITLNLAGVSGRSASYQIDAGTTFTSSIDGTTYTFQNLDRLTAIDDGAGLYTFATSAGETDILLTEGTAKTKEFIVGPNDDNAVYVIPDSNLDLATVSVKVYRSLNSSIYDEFADILDVNSIDSSSNVYFIKESPNGYYEIAFGDGTTFGAALVAGNKISVEYLRSSGVAGNEGDVFAPSTSVTVGATDYDYTITTVASSAGGSAKESIESIRRNAPFQFAAQNRMVTPSDYTAIVMREYSSYIDDIYAYGGEDAPEPKYGTVYMSILFGDSIPAATVTNVKNQIRVLVERLAIVSFDIEFIDPLTTYVGVQTFFQYNPSETPLSQSKIEESVNEVVEGYFTDNLGLFDKSFRRSNMLTLIDDSSNAIFSSRANVQMIQRIEPTLSASNEFSLSFPSAIAGADDVEYRVTSSYFTIDGDTCYIRNALNQTKLQVYNVSGSYVQVDNVGSYDATAGTVTISGLEPDTIIGGVDYLKIKVTPANQSAITPTLNNVLKIDSGETFATGVQTSAAN